MTGRGVVCVCVWMCVLARASVRMVACVRASLCELHSKIHPNCPSLTALHPLSACVCADVVSGQVVARLKYHREVVRDMSWHPTRPLLVSASFDGCLCQFENFSEEFKDAYLPCPRYDCLDD